MSASEAAYRHGVRQRRHGGNVAAKGGILLAKSISAKSRKWRRKSAKIGGNGNASIS
jgi:hypothetical protein